MSTYLSSGNVNEDTIEASFRIIHRITRNCYAIGNNVTLPSIKDAVSCIFGKDYIRPIVIGIARSYQPGCVKRLWCSTLARFITRSRFCFFFLLESWPPYRLKLFFDTL